MNARSRQGNGTRLAMVCVLLVFSAMAWSEPVPVVLEVLEVDPAGRTELYYDENFHLRIAYETDRPIRIFTRPYFRGEQAIAGNGPLTHPAQLLAPGKGETLGWFAYRGYANVDEVRITAVAEGEREPIATLSHPLRLYWDDRKVSNRRAPPAWVAALGSEQQRAVSQPVPVEAEGLWLGELLILALFALILLGIAWPAWLAFHWRGRWRLAAGLPLVVLGVWILVLVASWAADPTAHNLWPFELVMWAAGTFVYLVVVVITHRSMSPVSQ